MSGHDIPHHAENKDQKRIGIAIAIMAVFTAVVGALANNESNHMIVKEVKSSNGYAWYQAKRQRSYANELELKRIEVQLNGAVTDAQRKLLEDDRAKLKSKNAEYEKENEDIHAQAEKELAEAEVAAHRHHLFEYGEVLLHIAVVLCSLTLLTEWKFFYRLGIVASVCGLLLAAYTLLPHQHATSHTEAAAAPAAAEHK
jgi:hypothetical protein